MTQEGRVEQDFWTTGRSDIEAGPAAEEAGHKRVRPLLKALAVAKNRITESPEGDNVVIDLRFSQVGPKETDLDRAAAAAVEGVTDAIRSRDQDHTPVAEADSLPEPESAPIPPGQLWRESVQGWVSKPGGEAEWRPIVTTTTDVAGWELDVNLGMVTGESACAVDSAGLGDLVKSERGRKALRHVLAKDRRIAETAMVGEAVARGAHAVIGVKLDYTYLGECLIVTATGTAVTLKNRG
jgi:uncharacterized protein YbjQ (UPF0145 family)